MTPEEAIKQAAAAMGKKGGSVKSEKKTLAVRENGKKGGRPRKEKGAIRKTHYAALGQPQPICGTFVPDEFFVLPAKGEFKPPLSYRHHEVDCVKCLKMILPNELTRRM